MVRSDLGAVGRHVHARHRVRLRPGRVHHGVVRPRRDGRAGRGESGRVLRLQAEPRRRPAGDPAQDASAARRSGWYSPTRSGPGSRPRRAESPTTSGIRFSITDAEAQELARYAVTIEKHYGRPMDIEWGRDGVDGKLYILQARPETVKSREDAGEPAPLPAEVHVRRAGERPRDRAEDRAGRGAPRQVRRGDGPRARRATCSSPT